MDASGFARDCHGGSRHSAGERLDLSAQAGGFAASRARKSRDLGPHQGPDRQVSATDLLRKSFPLVRPDTKLCGNVVSVQAVVGLGHLQTFGESRRTSALLPKADNAARVFSAAGLRGGGSLP